MNRRIGMYRLKKIRILLDGGVSITIVAKNLTYMFTEYSTKNTECNTQAR